MLEIGDIVCGKKESFQKNINENLIEGIVVYIDNWDALIYVVKHNLPNIKQGNVIKADTDNLIKIGKYNKDVDALGFSCCPNSGPFIGFAKGYDEKENEYIITLKIPSDAFRTGLVFLSDINTLKKINTTNVRCRCSKAKVLKITPLQPDCKCADEIKEIELKQKEYTLTHSNAGDKDNYKKTQNVYYKKYIFTLGKTVEDKNCIKNKWINTTGIYFYMTPLESQTN